MAGNGISTAAKLPFVPDSMDGESFSSWLGRLARLYAGSAAELLRRLGVSAAYDGDRPHRDTVAGLAAACGLNPQRFDAMTLGTQSFADSALSRRLSLSKPPQRLGPFLLFDGRRRFCPVCLDAPDPIWPLAWRVGIPICPHHRVWLERACGQCAAKLSNLGPEPPTRCAVCFTPFRTTRPGPAPYTPLLVDLGERIAATRNARDTICAQDWNQLGQQAQAFAVRSDSGRVAFAEFLAWAERTGQRLPLAALNMPHRHESTVLRAASFPKALPPRPTRRPDPFPGLRRRSVQAVDEARRQLIAEGQGLTERAWRRRADHLLRAAASQAS